MGLQTKLKRLKSIENEKNIVFFRDDLNQFRQRGTDSL